MIKPFSYQKGTCICMSASSGNYIIIAREYGIIWYKIMRYKYNHSDICARSISINERRCTKADRQVFRFIFGNCLENMNRLNHYLVILIGVIRAIRYNLK